MVKHRCLALLALALLTGCERPAELSGVTGIRIKSKGSTQVKMQADESILVEKSEPNSQAGQKPLSLPPRYPLVSISTKLDDGVSCTSSVQLQPVSSGVKISRSTLCGWKELKYNLKHEYLGTDELGDHFLLELKTIREFIPAAINPGDEAGPLSASTVTETQNVIFQGEKLRIFPGSEAEFFIFVTPSHEQHQAEAAEVVSEEKKTEDEKTESTTAPQPEISNSAKE